jgi:hypothetical protein
MAQQAALLTDLKSGPGEIEKGDLPLVGLETQDKKRP